MQCSHGITRQGRGIKRPAIPASISFPLPSQAAPLTFPKAYPLSKRTTRLLTQPPQSSLRFMEETAIPPAAERSVRQRAKFLISSAAAAHSSCCPFMAAHPSGGRSAQFLSATGLCISQPQTQSPSTSSSACIPPFRFLRCNASECKGYQHQATNTRSLPHTANAFSSARRAALRRVPACRPRR